MYHLGEESKTKGSDEKGEKEEIESKMGQGRLFALHNSASIASFNRDVEFALLTQVLPFAMHYILHRARFSAL